MVVKQYGREGWGFLLITDTVTDTERLAAPAPLQRVCHTDVIIYGVPKGTGEKDQKIGVHEKLPSAHEKRSIAHEKTFWGSLETFSLPR